MKNSSLLWDFYICKYDDFSVNFDVNQFSDSANFFEKCILFQLFKTFENFKLTLRFWNLRKCPISQLILVLFWMLTNSERVQIFRKMHCFQNFWKTLEKLDILKFAGISDLPDNLSSILDEQFWKSANSKKTAAFIGY